MPTQTAAKGQSTSSNPQHVDGVVLRGADGKLYFIPHQDLQAYEVQDVEAKKAALAEDPSKISQKAKRVAAVRVTLPPDACVCL